MDQDIKALQSENQTLKSELEYVKNYVQRQENTAIQNNIIVSGLCNDPKEEMGSVREKTMKVLTFVDESILVEDISTIKIIKQVENLASVQVSFKDTKKKYNLLRMRYQRGKITGEICSIPSVKNIYINEEMTVGVYKLLKYSNQLREYGYQYVWQRGGIVYSRLNQTAKAIRIKTTEQVDEMIKNNMQQVG